MSMTNNKNLILNSSHWTIPLLLFIFSLALRLHLISKGPYHIDAFHIAMKSNMMLETGILQNLFGFGYPLTLILGSLFIYIAKFFNIHDPVIAVNFMSVLLSSLCIPIFYYINKKMFSSSCACFSAIILATTPIFLGISTYAKSHAPSLFFLLLGIFYILNYAQEKKLHQFILAIIFIGFLGATRLQDMILTAIPVSFLFCFTTNNQKFPLRKTITQMITFWILAGCITILFHLPYFLSEKTNNYQQQLNFFFSLGLFKNFRGFFSVSLTHCFTYLKETFTPAGLTVALLGILYLIKTGWRNFIFIWLWILIPFSFYGNLHTTAPRFLTIVLPAIITAQGYLYSQFLKFSKPFHYIAISLFLFSTFSSFYSIYPKLKFRHDHALVIEYSQWINSQTEENAYIICSDESSLLQHYSKRKAMKRLYAHKNLILSKEEFLEYKKYLDQVLAENIPVYITYVGLFGYDYKNQFSTFMKANYDFKFIGTHSYESWHRGSSHHVIFDNNLWRMKLKN